MSRSKAFQQQLAALSVRLDAMERQMKQVRTWTDSEFRRHLQRVAPWPLQQVYEFRLVLKREFWQDTLKVTADEIATAENWGGAFPHRVSIERWRSHRQIRLYGDPNNPCPTRVLLLKEPGDVEVVELWRMDFTHVDPGQSREQRRLELYLEDDSIRLGTIGGEFGHGFRHGTGGPFLGPAPAGILVDVPLWRSPQELEKFKPPPDGDEPDPGELYYTHADSSVGVTWHLHVEDLRSLHESEIAEEYSDPFDE